MQQHGVRMPKIESMENTGMMSQAVRFSQTFQPSHPQSHMMAGGHPASMANQPKPGPIQGQGSIFDSPIPANQDQQLIMRPITPSPNAPPQLHLQMVGPTPLVGQHSVPPSPISPHPSSHGRRTASPKGAPPSTPQPGLRDSFQDIEKSIQRWPSTSSEQGLSLVTPDMQLSQQTASAPQTSGFNTIVSIQFTLFVALF